MDSYLISSILAGATLTWYLYHLSNEKKANPRRLPRPPGPKGYPIVGNMFNTPKSKAWVIYDQWFKQYGDMVYFENLGQPFLVLGSTRRTNDLFDKRSGNYAGRPKFPRLFLMGWEFNLALVPYGDWWRRQRRAFHQHFHSNKIQIYHPSQTKGARGFLRRLLSNPNNFWEDVRHQFGATIMDVSYGITVKETNDPYIALAETSLEGVTESNLSGHSLVDLIPALKYLPSWFPGGGWKKEVERQAVVSEALCNKPFDFVKEQVRAGTARPSIASNCIENLRGEDEATLKLEETIAKNVAAVAYIAGSETTVTTVYSFILAMCLYPDVQKKAQAELDEVLSGRLPEFSDRPFLPYIDAMVKEILRWRPVGPIVVPHATIEDDEYDGYFIPKGTIVVASTWALLSDPEYFPDPDRFMPERYLTEDRERNMKLRELTTAAFGQGRRICPGRHFSDASMFITIASVLSAFNINPPLDKEGKRVNLQPPYVEDFIMHPKRFECLIEPRSKRAAELVRNSELFE